MLKTAKPHTGITAQEFAKFNEDLYYDTTIPTDKFKLPDNLEEAKVTPEEVQTIIE
jgi:hypothetical protein